MAHSSSIGIADTLLIVICSTASLQRRYTVTHFCSRCVCSTVKFKLQTASVQPLTYRRPTRVEVSVTYALAVISSLTSPQLTSEAFRGFRCKSSLLTPSVLQWQRASITEQTDNGYITALSWPVHAHSSYTCIYISFLVSLVLMAQRSSVWEHFDVNPCDQSHATCKL